MGTNVTITKNVTKRIKDFTFRGKTYRLAEGQTPADVIAGSVKPLEEQQTYEYKKEEGESEKNVGGRQATESREDKEEQIKENE